LEENKRQSKLSVFSRRKAQSNNHSSRFISMSYL
jgi:hypothetical protein